MIYMTKTIIALIITFLMQSCAISMVESTPKQAADEFLSALKEQDTKVMERYLDNSYVNFVCNAEGDSKTIGRMNDALFKNFDYKIEKTKQKDGVAAARVVITSRDYSEVMDKYEDISYDYIMDNLYKDEIGDKSKLEKKCLEIYVEEIEKASKSGDPVETVVFIPMVDNGYHGWNVIMTDELMKAVLGNLEMPVKSK